MSNNISFYDSFTDYDAMVNWAQRLDREWPFFADVFARATSGDPRRRVLDVGCASGWHAAHFAKAGCDVVAIDPSAEMVRRAQQAHCNTPHLRFVQAGFDEIQALTGAFDVVTCLGNTLPHALDRASLELAINNMAQVLRPRALLVVQQLNYDRILATRQRFLGVTPSHDSNDETLFFRFYDFNDPLVEFNLVTFRHNHNEWSYRADHTTLRPIVSAEMREVLALAGFENVEQYGSYDRTQFRPETSTDLVIVATNRAS